MTDTLEAIARSLGNDVERLAAISHNIANLNTPAFRGVRAIPAFDGHGALNAAIVQGDGGLAQTARGLDLALRGPGFFVIERSGRLLLARSGAFRVNGDGLLANASGDIVLGVSGPIAVPDDGEPVRIDASGALWSGFRQLGQLRLVAVADASLLRPAGEGAYSYEGALAPWQGSVVQGALERANVDPAEETVRLMETTRHAESVQRAISIYDKAMDVGINRLGEN